jgi:hypothetical protein
MAGQLFVDTIAVSMEQVAVVDSGEVGSPAVWRRVSGVGNSCTKKGNAGATLALLFSAGNLGQSQ